jgi:hypothetical protein
MGQLDSNVQSPTERSTKPPPPDDAILFAARAASL